MRVLLAGDWHSELHEEVALHALRHLGHEVKAFRWCHYFKRPKGAFGVLVHLLRRAQNKYLMGPVIGHLNRDLIAAALQFKPEVLFVYRGTHVTRATLLTIKKIFPDCVLIGYNNDDPFSPAYPTYVWRHFLRAVPAYDLMLAYRHANLTDLRGAGAQRVELLRSWYVPERNHPVELSEDDKKKYEADVVFIGHYEDDQRLECLEAIVRQGVRLRLFGPGYDWDPVIQKSSALSGLAPVRLVWGEDYNRALCGAKIALCFLSKLNRDTYTRRCFEIPATGTLMLSEYSDDLSSLYKAGVEADFFRNRDEMMEKIRYYLTHEEERQRVARSGQLRVTHDRHDVTSRMAQVVQWAADIKAEIL